MADLFSDREREDRFYMGLALEEAGKAAEKEEIPVGAVITCRGEVVGRGHNRREEKQSPLAHAEIAAIEAASSRLGSWRLSDATLYVTLEPCVMCVGAILQARLPRLVFGALDPKGGAVASLYRLCEDERLNHRVEVTQGVLGEESARLLEEFFARLREKKKALKKSGEAAEAG